MKPSVLIIDDDIQILAILSDAFSSGGFNVATCATGEDAEVLISERHFEAVVIDQILPGKLGSDLLPFACASVDAVIFITGDDGFESSVAYNKNANIVIRKPFDPKDVVSAAIRYISDDENSVEMDGAFRKSFESLTERERQVLEKINEGMVASEIGKLLGISSQTVFKHRAAIRRKFDGLKLLQICKTLNR